MADAEPNGYPQVIHSPKDRKTDPLEPWIIVDQEWVLFPLEPEDDD